MTRAKRALFAVGSLGLLATGSILAQQPARPMAPTNPPATQSESVMDSNDQEVQKLLSKLTEFSDQIAKSAQNPDSWRLHLGQAEVMLHLAVRARTGKERDDWLRMAVDSHYSAAVQAPESETTVHQRLTDLPGQITRAFPNCPVSSYAALQGVQADYMRALGKTGDDPAKAQEYLRDRLLRFAQENPRVEEAPKAIMEGGQISEQLNKPEDARRCYAYVVEHYNSHPLARKAEGAMWRMAPVGEPVEMSLPLLFPESDRKDQAFELSELKGKTVIVYYWSSTSSNAQIIADLEAIKRLTDRYQYRGLGVLYVNLDSEADQAKTFLSGKLTSGTHVHQKGGLESAIASRFGLQNLPHLMVVSREGTLIKHTVTTAQLESVLADHLPKARK